MSRERSAISVAAKCNLRTCNVRGRNIEPPNTAQKWGKVIRDAGIKPE